MDKTVSLMTYEAAHHLQDLIERYNGPGQAAAGTGDGTGGDQGAGGPQ